MNLNERITLLNAGYTKEEIAAFETAEPAAPAPAPAAPAAPAPAPADPEPAPADPEPAAPAAPAEPESDFKRLEATLNRFINLAQAANLNQSMNGQIPVRTTDSILADVISPKKKEK